MWFLFGEVSSSSGCLGWSTLFYCGTPRAFHIIIGVRVSVTFHLMYVHIILSSVSVAGEVAADSV